MWIMTIDGFYSAVQHRQHPQLMIVRARDYDDLVRLIEKTIPGVRPHDLIEETPKADYPCRVTLNVSHWAHYVATAAEDIDYDNFKSAVSQRIGPERSHVYHSVWAVLHRLEDEPLPFEPWRGRASYPEDPLPSGPAPFGPSSTPLTVEPSGTPYYEEDWEDSIGSIHRVPLSRPLPLDA